MTKLAVIKQKS